MVVPIILSRARIGMEAPLVRVETHLANGLPAFNLVGLPEAAVRESRERVRCAIQNAGFEYPSRRITVNLAPADLPKEGTRFDLAIALGILAASGQIEAARLEALECIAELALTGELRGVPGLLPAAVAARDAGRVLMLAPANQLEAGLVHGLTAYAPAGLRELFGHLSGTSLLTRCPPQVWLDTERSGLDLQDVRGQLQAKRALEVAAAGAHSLLMMGPPGTGKTMLARRLPTLLPRLAEQAAFESACLWSLSGRPVSELSWRRPPFRAPHHTASAAAVIGGGRIPQPGEISLAHHGVLFLDELPEFSRAVLESLREPLETGTVALSRAAARAEYPARFQFVGAMNPCPCGHAGDGSERCECTPDQVRRYRHRLSGPLLDRIDVHVEVARSRDPHHGASGVGEPSEVVRERVAAARASQLARQGKANAWLNEAELRRVAVLTVADRQFIDQAFERLGFSARAYDRILKVARTIADLAGRGALQRDDLTEAMGLRRFDLRPTPIHCVR